MIKLGGLVTQKPFKKEETINEDMDMGEFSDIFLTFFESINKNSKYMDDSTKNHLKKGLPHLHAAWKAETEAHGFDYGKDFKVKL